ncbi:hypothetical protein CerSpe_218010 [Prunus speciosa]
MEFLEDYDFGLHYHSRKANVVAYALSRKTQGLVASLKMQKEKMMETIRDYDLLVETIRDYDLLVETIRDYDLLVTTGDNEICLYNLIIQPHLKEKVIEMQRDDRLSTLVQNKIVA